MTRHTKALKDKIRSMLAAKDKGSEAYGLADRLMNELIDRLKVGEKVDLGGGETFEVVDNFADKNKVWKPTGVNRFDGKVSRAG